MSSNEHEPTNIGNPHEITILEFAQRILALTGSTVPIVFKPLPQDDPKQRCPDITKAKRILGWEPQVQLEEGLRRTLEYFKQQVAAGKAELRPAGSGRDQCGFGVQIGPSEAIVLESESFHFHGREHVAGVNHQGRAISLADALPVELRDTPPTR